MSSGRDAVQADLVRSVKEGALVLYTYRTRKKFFMLLTKALERCAISVHFSFLKA